MLLIGPSAQIVVLASFRAKRPVGIGGCVNAVACATGAFDDTHFFNVTHGWQNSS